MRYNAIPINYFYGAGGKFLSSFLHSACKHKPINWIAPTISFSEDPTGMISINHLVEYTRTIPENTVIYPHGHYADPDLLMKYFDKQIKIYFLPEQLDEVVGMFMLKHNKIPPSTDLTNIEEVERYKNHKIINWSKVAVIKFARLFNACPDLEPRMLNVSWNDMIYNDIEVLISKLHQFTEIPKENFNRDEFNEWRVLTHKTLDILRRAKLI